ncbi:selenide, water dikinase [Desulfosporosinus acididurans]|uniref:Selenide, water dikinase n=2 Tax=Desulfosporosinus acididurans TaxID=476652 RepID=A0A0J1FQG8_9FIRM|nr:selenide, water dikinase [Desulfosporosinus acididurans]
MEVLSSLPKVVDPKVLAGRDENAAVYKISDELAVVQTVDYITPVVDDPYQFGMIAAANSISDIYAMGVKPAFALNIVGYPNQTLPLSILEQILKGGADKSSEAGISIIGGHSVTDHAPKYGLVVTGFAHPEKLITKKGAKPGDALVLTKPLGIGVITTGIDRRLTTPAMEIAVIEEMYRLNRDASEAMVEVGVSACTDVTGFGLLGHLSEMLSSSGVGAKIYNSDVPLITGAIEMAEAGAFSGGAHNNFRYMRDKVTWENSISKEMRMILCDPQTSGGLLIAVDPQKLDTFLNTLGQKNVDAREIGTITKEKTFRVLE